MARQSDGSIIIDTKLDTEGFKKGSDKLQNAIKSLSNTTDRIAKGFSGLEKEAGNLVIKTVKAQRQANEGFKNQNQINKFRENLIDLAAAYDLIKSKLKTFGKTEFSDNSAHKQAVKNLEAALNSNNEARIAAARENIYKGNASGWKFTGADTKEYAEAAERLELVGNAIKRLDEIQKNAQPDDSVSSWNRFVSVMGLVGSAAAKATSALSKISFRAITTGLKAANTVLGGFITKIKNLVTRGSQSKNMINQLAAAFTSFKRILIGKVKSTIINDLFNSAKDNLQKLAAYSNSVNQAFSNLKNATSGLSANISVAFGNLITAIEPIVTRIINLLSKAVTYINAFFGLLSGKTTITVAADNANDYAAGMNGAAGATENAADAQKKLNEQLFGFDKLNKLDDQSSGSGGNGGGGGGGANGLWKEMKIDSLMPNSMIDFAQKIKDAIAKGDWEGVGKIIANGLNNVVKAVDEWNKNIFEPKAAQWATKIASLLNGLFTGWDSDATGSTLGGLLNTVLNAINTAVTTFKWGEAGKKFAGLVNGFFNRVDWSQLGTTVGNTIKGFWTLISNWAKDTQWSEHGTKIATCLSSLIKTGALSKKVEAIKDVLNGLIQWLGGFVKGLDWEAVRTELAEALSNILDIDIDDLILNLGTLIINFVHSLAQAVTDNKTKFVEFGYKVGDALSQLDWGQLLSDIGTIIIDGIVSIIAGLSQTDFGRIAGAIAAGLAAIKITGTALSGIKLFSSLFANKVTETVVSSASQAAPAMAETVAGGLGTALSGALTTVLGVGTIAAAAAGFIYAISLRFTTEGADEARNALKGIRTKISELQSETNSGQYAIDGKKIIADELLERYSELASKTDLTSTEQSELQQIVENLVAIYPELNSLVDGQTGAFKADAETISGVVTELDRLYKIQGMQEAMTKAWDVYGEAVYAASEQEAKLKAMMELRDALQNNDIETIKTHKDLLEECGISYDSLEAAISGVENAGDDYYKKTQAMNSLVAAEDFALDKLNGTIDAQQSSVDGLNNEVDNAKNVVMAMTEELGYLNDGFNLVGNTLSGTLNSYDSLREALTYLNSEGKITEDQYSALLAQLAESESSGATAEEALSGIEEGLGALGITVENISGDVEDAMGDIVETMEGAANDAEDAGVKTGESYGSGVEDGLESKDKDLKKAAKGASDTVYQNLDKRTKDVKKIGANQMQNESAGIRQNMKKPADAATQAANKTYNNLNSKTTSSKQIGSGMLTNMNTGLKDTSRLNNISTSGKNAANKAYNGLNSKSTTAKTAGQNYLTNYNTGLQNTTTLNSINTSGKAAAGKAYNGLNSRAQDAKTSGQNYLTSYNSGLSDNTKLSLIHDAGVSAADKAHSGLSIYNDSTHKYSIYKVGQKIADQAKAGINANRSGVKTAGTSAADEAWYGLSIYNTGASDSNSIYNIGINAIRGLVNGIEAMYDRVKAAAKSTADAIISIMNSTLKIGSPSKVMAEIGKYTVQGLPVGFKKAAPEAIHTMSGIASDIVDAANTGDMGLNLSSDVMLRGLDAAADKLSGIANIFGTIGAALEHMGGLIVPDVVRGSSVPARTAVRSITSGYGTSQTSSEMGSSIETQNALLQEQNQLLQQLIKVAGQAPVISTASITNGLNRANRRAGSVIVPVEV